MKTSRHFKITILCVLIVSGLAFFELERQAVTTLPSRLTTPPTVAIPTAQVFAPDITHAHRPSKPDITNTPLSPCAQQIALRIGTIDPEFNMTRASLEAALRDAANEWNSATGRAWFAVTSSEGIAVNLLFDGRQAELNELKTAETELDIEIALVSKEREERDLESQEIDQNMVAFNQEREHYEALVATHNDAVARASKNGTLSQETVAQFHAEEERLSQLRGRLETSAQRIKKQVDDYTQRARSTQRRGELLQTKIAELKERFPPRLVREAEHRKGAFVNEINVYTISDAKDLHYTLLHELGHTLGLDHAKEDDAIMSPIRKIGASRYNLTDSDIAAARALCT